MNELYQFGTTITVVMNIIAGLLIAMFIIGVITAMRQKSARKNKNPEQPSAEKVRLKNLPEQIRTRIEELSRTRDLYARLNIPVVARHLDAIITNVKELTNRVQKAGDQDQIITVTGRYDDIFDKLLTLLGTSYYLDIYRHRKLWTDPERRMRDVEDKLVEVNAQILDNIRQVNARRDLDFKVALRSLTDTHDNDLDNVLRRNAESLTKLPEPLEHPAEKE